jgi:F0F1-type ATP synthase alpha subunit
MTNLSLSDLTAELQSAINDLKTKPEISETGIVTKVSDGIVWIYGLMNCGYN